MPTTTTTTTTIAERVAVTMGDDGTKMVAPDGRTLEDVALAFGAGVCRGNDDVFSVRYVFSDGSAVTSASGLWDIGYPSCNCWRTNGHSRYCTAGGV